MDTQFQSFIAGLTAPRGSRRRFSARPFYLVLLSLLVLSAGVLVATTVVGAGASLRTGDSLLAKRDVSLVLEEDVQEVSV